jgi:hypothetical protein
VSCFSLLLRLLSFPWRQTPTAFKTRGTLNSNLLGTCFLPFRFIPPLIYLQSYSDSLIYNAFYTTSHPKLSLMPHAYEVKLGEKHSLYNNDETECPGRKIPRLTLSKDVKTLLPPNETPNKFSLVLPSIQISQLPSRPEIKNPSLSPYSREGRMSEWDTYYPQEEVELTEYQQGEKPFALNYAYPDLIPITSRRPNMTTLPVESLSRGHPSRYFLSNVQNHPRSNRPRYARLRPAPFYPSPIQSTAPSLKSLNTSPPPTQPSPSLPLHQPRPSKRIPIISLSRLALACEDLEAPQIVSDKSRSKTTSNNLDFSDVGVVPQDLGHHQTPEKRTAPELRNGIRPRHVVRCYCGCMGSYAIG